MSFPNKVYLPDKQLFVKESMKNICCSVFLIELFVSFFDYLIVDFYTLVEMIRSDRNLKT